MSVTNINKKDKDDNLSTEQKIGKILQGARLAKRLSLQEVGQELNIRAVYLEALEGGKFEIIEHAVYLNGFLKTYACFLGLDEEALCAMYQEVRISQTPPQESPYKEVGGVEGAANAEEKAPKGSGSSHNANPGLAITIASLGALALVIVGWYAHKNGLFTGTENPSAPLETEALSPASTSGVAGPSPLGQGARVAGSQAPKGQLPGPETQNPDAAAPAGPSQGLFLQARDGEEVWVALEDKNQQRFVSQTLKNGARLDLPEKTAYVVLGNAGGVELHTGGKSADLGSRGAVKKYTRQQLLDLFQGPKS